ncbi:MAG: FAD-dependent oxidoreductase, partial [Clostridia bacterium]|nr:FAD-dependent oxidoreductase [Clostridia bacterium]
CDGRFYKDRDVIVVGGGNSAVSDAAYLSNLASRVYLVHRRDTFRAERINMKALEAARNVELVKSSELIRTVGDGKIEGAVIKDRKTGNEHTLKASGIFISIGRQPSTELFKSQIQLDENGYVVADETTKTAIPGVFAAGDVRTKELRQVVTAAADGAVAAHFAEEYILTEHK